MTDDMQNGVIGKFKILGGEPVCLKLFFVQVGLGNGQFFAFHITRNANDFHAVLQRGRDALQRIGGGYKHHLRQVVININIVIIKRVVLLGIKYFQQGG